MTINIVCFGKLSNDWQILYDDYAKQINNFKINVIELKEIANKNLQQKIDFETELIISKIPKNSKIIVLAIQGKVIDSTNFSKHLSCSNITFVIGGSNGLNLTMFPNNTHFISFSKMTFPHQLFRVMLIEQIYRGFKIQQNSNYHK